LIKFVAEFTSGSKTTRMLPGREDPPGRKLRRDMFTSLPTFVLMIWDSYTTGQVTLSNEAAYRSSGCSSKGSMSGNSRKSRDTRASRIRFLARRYTRALT